MQKFHPALLSLLSGLLLFAAWPVSVFTPLIFIGFVPLFMLCELNIRTRRKFGCIFITMLIWNVGTTWWMCNSTFAGGIAAMVANSFLMCLPWLAYLAVRKRLGQRIGYISLVLFWLSFEYIHLNWELSWPWLTLGNVFATHTAWIQWYEITGVSGGSLWVLILNLLVFLWLTAYWHKDNVRRYQVAAVVLLVLPVIVSYGMLNANRKAASLADKTGGSNIVIVQPNIDPWDEKFVAGKQEAQLQKLIHLSEFALDSNTALVVWPETAIPVAINEDSIHHSYFINPVWDFLHRHPKINLMTGMEGFRLLDENHKTIYSRRIPQSPSYFDAYNSALMMDSNQVQVYHKSKLVPGAEVLPSFLHFLGVWFEKFGGTAGGYARQDERTVLLTYNNSYKVAPAVCYESIYGDFMTSYVHKGANVIAVITNDGWWGNTAGYRQHESYSRLLAVEMRRWVARSANTGISCYINPVGDVTQQLPWDKSGTLKQSIPTEHELTVYVRYGDIIFKIAAMLAGLLILWYIVALIMKKRLAP